MGDWLDEDPPQDRSLAKAYWCDVNYFLAHTGSGEHPNCEFPDDMGHNDPNLTTAATQAVSS